MPKIIDERARRETIAEAVWAITSREGLDGATVRAVAAECGLSTGAIQHSFPSQAALQQFAMELIVERVTERLTEMGTADPRPVPCAENATASNNAPASAFDREHPVASRVIAAVSWAVLAVALVTQIPNLLNSLVNGAAWLGFPVGFSAPTLALPGWLNTLLSVLGIVAGLDRGLRMVHNPLLDD